MRLTNPGFYGVVAEEAGNIVGSNFVYLRSPVAGISPITIDPVAQNRRIGRTPDAGSHRSCNGTGKTLHPPCAGGLQ
jgi:hypothetical protein